MTTYAVARYNDGRARFDNLTDNYRDERARGWPASQALRNARVRMTWYELDGEVTAPDEWDEDTRVRLVIDWDETLSYDDIACSHDGDKRCHERDRERVARDGIVYVLAQFRHPVTGEWESVDSVGGFIGDDWMHSGYDIDLMESAIEALERYSGC